MSVCFKRFDISHDFLKTAAFIVNRSLGQADNIPKYVESNQFVFKQIEWMMKNSCYEFFAVCIWNKMQYNKKDSFDWSSWKIR